MEEKTLIPEPEKLSCSNCVFGHQLNENGYLCGQLGASNAIRQIKFPGSGRRNTKMAIFLVDANFLCVMHRSNKSVIAQPETEHQIVTSDAR